MQIYMMATLSLVGSVVILGLGVPVASEASQQKGRPSSSAVPPAIPHEPLTGLPPDRISKASSAARRER
ncbi:hypothetical protein [Novosphingobium panipatense]|uniref:hypothetical protein n=1 Tax=Novosphingobium panipatense TaxID=428991 RepID=UPI00360A4314